MNNATNDETFTISSKETLLPLHQQPSPIPSPPTKPPLTKYRKRIFTSSLILLIVVACFITLRFIHKNKNRENPNTYLARSKNYYCHVTKYSNLCRESMSAVLNTTLLESNPSPIFSASIKIAVNQLNDAAFTIAKALSTTGNSSKVLQCEKLLHGALSQFNESMSMLSVDANVESLLTFEIDEIKAMSSTAVNGASECLLALEGVESGVEEVKGGVERARKCVINSVGLMNNSDNIYSDFYFRFVTEGDESYYYGSFWYDPLNYGVLVVMYGVMYLLVALLFLLFWRTPVN